ncbi:MAG: hypothetical protein QXQ76_01720 [Candidatus Bathyarchaeia archaeon]
MSPPRYGHDYDRAPDKGLRGIRRDPAGARGGAQLWGGGGDRVRIQLRGHHYSIRDRPERIFVGVHYEDGPLIAELAGYEIDYEFVAEGGDLGHIHGQSLRLGPHPG